MSKHETNAAPAMDDLPVGVGDTAPAILANYPVFAFKGDIKAVIAANLEGETVSFSDLDRIKVPSGGATTWKIPSLDGEKKADEFEGIVAMFKCGRSYWESEYTGEGTPPDCASLDGLNGRGNPGGVCENCKLNEFGSSPKGGNGKACKEVRSIFIVMPGSFLPIVLNVPPTGLKDFKRYRLRLANNGVNLTHTLTKFTLTEDKNKGGIEFSKIVFTKGEALPPAEAARMDAYVESLRPVFERAHNEAVRDGSAYAAGENPYGD